MNVLAHNLSAMNAQRMYSVNTGLHMKSSEKLSSNYKINRAADDASGLAISEKMRRQIRGLSQASRNAQDGISVMQIADGALVEVHDMLQRGNELAVKAANGTLSASDRADINHEIQQLKEAIDQVGSKTKFNEMYIFPPSGQSPLTVSSNHRNSYDLEFGDDMTLVTHFYTGMGDIQELDTGNALAAKIAQEYVPNAVNQIFSSFGSLKDIIDNTYTGNDEDKLKMALDITYVDGPGKTLAYVEGRFYTSNQTLASMSLTVDSSDFSPEDIKNGDSDKLGKLESTIAHEMMHAVMDAALPDRMNPNGGTEDLPKWFKEGTAQLTGGGYTTGWNDTLKNIVRGGTDVDNKISEYLKKYKVETREYGHGYLAAAYMGYLASGGTGEVTAEKIADGMNDIFQKLGESSGMSLEDAVNAVLTAAGSSKTYQNILDDINNGTTDGTAFVRELTTKSLNGAGSVIAADGLKAAATSVLGTGSKTSKIYVDLKEADPAASLNGMRLGGDTFNIHVGADATESNQIRLKLFRMSSRDLGLNIISYSGKDQDGGDSVYTVLGDANAISIFGNAIKMVSSVRSYYGAMQNRMEHTIRNLDNVIENTTASESKLRDTDVASEMVKYTTEDILIRAGQSMMAQANQQNQGILALL